jgi:hypothetical protein
MPCFFSYALKLPKFDLTKKAQALVHAPLPNGFENASGRCNPYRITRKEWTDLFRSSRNACGALRRVMQGYYPHCKSTVSETISNNLQNHMETSSRRDMKESNGIHSFITAHRTPVSHSQNSNPTLRGHDQVVQRLLEKGGRCQRAVGGFDPRPRPGDAV